MGCACGNFHCSFADTCRWGPCGCYCGSCGIGGCHCPLPYPVGTPEEPWQPLTSEPASSPPALEQLQSIPILDNTSKQLQQMPYDLRLNYMMMQTCSEVC